MSPVQLTVLVFLAACTGETTAVQHVAANSLSFDIPADWARQDAARPRETQSEWRPVENDGKESLLVINADRASIARDADFSVVEETLVRSTGNALQRSEVRQFSTKTGLRGVVVETDFVPLGSSARYHRIHAVLRDDTGALIHVVYTGRTPDPARTTFNTVIDSIRRGEV